MSWTPLLTGELAERAMARARQIAMAQAAAPTGTPADRVLYWAYTSAVFDEEFANDAYADALDDMVGWLQRGAPHLGLFGGVTNAGWVLCHTLDADGSEESLGAIDDALLRVLAVDEWRGAHDLVEGLVGFGVYFLERIAHGATKGHEGLARVVAHLERTALKLDAATDAASIETRGKALATWHTPLSLLPPGFEIEYPHGFYDCGIAHGVPGMIAMLARAAAHVPEARALAVQAYRWLDEQWQDRELPGKLVGSAHDVLLTTRARGARVVRGRAESAANAAQVDAARAAQTDATHAVGAVRRAQSEGAMQFEPARTAWCYGDPGIALAMWAARAAFGNDAKRAKPDDDATRDASMRDAAMRGNPKPCASSTRDIEQLALAAMSRDPATARVTDATLCHGAAGLGHISNRFFHATRNPAFADVARMWFERTLAMPDPDSAAFLDGSAGVGLALVAASTWSDPAWDRLLLADLAYSEPEG